jgi:hypothetical protein
MDQMVRDAVERGVGERIIENLNDKAFKGMESGVTAKPPRVAYVLRFTT